MATLWCYYIPSALPTTRTYLLVPICPLPRRNLVSFIIVISLAIPSTSSLVYGDHRVFRTSGGKAGPRPRMYAYSAALS
ncbi:hypothetical protein JAAARDRAFT_42874 [Jaapia argillacea MUCL 33604]|uniref:Uncharacterized protein n=1 Tax=Jaapia argillacea MUCL 33604 TaxID=933084 RepID=A0A067PEN7_9AGAM|nr:hypothetical protein JAAARDRAFT_42874 [Jaapia argillacea MUCL 33604]